MNVDRNKIEQIDRDITYILNKARSAAEGERKVIRGWTEKLKIRSSVKYWTAMIKKKEGKSVSQLRLNKWKKDARLEGNDDNKRLSECKNEWSKALEEWENFKEEKNKCKEKETLERHSVELPEGDEKEREKRKKCCKAQRRTWIEIGISNAWLKM